MSKNKRGGGADELYRAHLYGTPFAGNPTNNRQSMLERMYMRLLTELASNRFKWDGLPDTVNVRFLELTLFYRALSVFYYDEDYDKYLSLEAGSNGFFDMLKDPTSFTTVGNDYVSKTLAAYRPYKTYDSDEAKKRTAIPIWANYVRVPDWDIVQIYSQRLAELDMTIEINAKNTRQNMIVVTGDDTRLSAVNIARQAQEGNNVIQVQAEGPLSDMQFMQTLNLNQDVDGVEKLHIVRTRMWNECMGLMGINNANQDKKERVVAAEVDANDDQTEMMRYVNLNARRQAAQHIKDVHGLDVSVEYYTDEPVAPPALPGLTSGEVEDEHVYSELEEGN